MNKTDKTTLPPSSKDGSEDLRRKIADAAEGSVIKLEKGEYLLSSPLLFKGKKNLTFDGNGSVLMPFYDVSDDGTKGSDCIHLDDCENVTLRNFRIAASAPTNVSGRITEVTDEYTEVRVTEKFLLPENPYICQAKVFSEDGTPITSSFLTKRGPWGFFAEEIPNSHPGTVCAEYERTDGFTFRLFDRLVSAKTVVGAKINLVFFDKLCAVRFRSCRSITVENAEITNFGGMGFVILPSSRDFTFKNVRIASDDPENRPYALLADAIHTTGLGGRLLIEDCHFEGIGDDTTNIHTPILTVRAKKGDYCTLIFDKENPIFPKRWGKAGDVIRVYEKETLRIKGETRLTYASENQIAAENSELLEEGDFVVNTEYCPDIVIRSCVAQKSRARIAVQAAKSLLVENCTLRQCPIKPQLYISAAFRYWGEGGGVENVTIRNNILDAIAEDGRAVFIRLNEKDGYGKDYFYKNVSIENNTVSGIIDVNKVHGLRLSGNRFTASAGAEKSVRIAGDCTDVTVE